MSQATVIVHWPGQDTPACEEHARKLIGLGKMMGFVVSTTPCVSDEICKNCENEKKRG